MAQEGTPAYRAPEVIRGETYSFKADVFSLGITLYALVTGGRHPFDDYDFKSEMDRVVAEGHLPPPITHKGCAPWPDMQKILASCMHQSPDRRPTSSQVWEQLTNPEILGLKRIIPISKGTTVECFTIQEQEGGRLYLWVASGDCDYVQLSRLDLKDSKPEVKEPNATPMYLSPGKKHEAVRCLEAHPRTRRVYSSCGSKIVVLSVRKGIALEKILETRKEGPRSVPIYGLCVSNKSQVFVCHKGQPVIQVWDIAKETLKAQIDVSSLVGLKSTQCRLTALYLQENHGIAAMNHGILWAGTGDGRIVLIDSKSGTTIASTHRYCGPIRALKSSACKKNKHARGNFCGVLSGGFGYYNSQEHSDKKDRGNYVNLITCCLASIQAFQEGKLSKSLEPVHLNSGLRHGESEESLQNFEQSTQEVPQEESPENPQCHNEAEQSLQENEMFDSL
uniref:non-specific serine/threonine protein kinase n=1 Tax=Magallana gigas TaxID=29159 RepID=K1QN12_MAGGI